jgi:proteic killer suppression protein
MHVFQNLDIASMLIEFEKDRMRRIFEFEKNLRKEYNTLTPAIKRRLDDFAAYETLAELQYEMPHIRCHELTGGKKGYFAVNVSGNNRLIFRPGENPVPLKVDGGIDLQKVKRIIILEISDYH